MKTNRLFTLLLIICFMACSDEPNSNEKATHVSQETSTSSAKKSQSKVPVFEKLSPESTGINFSNRIKETTDLNIYTFEYFYNGAGVSVGDVNNDGLADLYFSCNQCPNRLYINRGNLKFENITKSSGIEARGKFKTGTAMVDINNDGFLDIFALRSGKDELMDRRNYVFINNKDLTFSNQSSTLGLDPPTNSIHVNFIDYDRDGDIDVFYGNHPLDLFTNNQLRVLKENGGFKINDIATNQEESQKLFRNDNGKFVNVAEQVGIARRSFALSSIVSDFNDDGYPDIFVGNDYIDPDYLFINQKNGKFKDERASYFKVMSQNTMGTDYEDVNNDGLMDLVATDMLADTRQRRHELGNNMFRDYFDQSVAYGYGAQVFKNVLQINQGNGKYSEQSYLRGVHASDWTWAALLADFNNNGSKDLYVTNGFRRDISDLDFMDFRDANQGKAMDVSNISELMDLIPSTAVSNKFYININEGVFQDATKEAGLNHPGFSHGAVYADLDNDGDLELIVNNVDEPASIYKNMSRENDPDNSNYLSVRLKGPNGNLFGINAKARLYVGDKIMLQEYRPMKGYMSCVENRLHFGLGNSTSVNKIEIEWPDGKVEVVNNPKINQEFIAEYKNAGARKRETLPSPKYSKAKIPGLVFRHKDKKYNDFNREPLLLHKYSDTGPAFVTGDLNGDGLDDYYVGGGAGQNGSVCTQLNQGGFGVISTLNKKADAKFEDTDACLFDADGDNDLDLYIVSGGSEYDTGNEMYSDRLLINDGKAKFTLSDQIPDFKENGSCVTAGDFDGDGDMDLFVGSKVVPGRFPEIPMSRVLQNEGGVFTNFVAQNISKAGLISDAEWVDLDADGKSELVVAGEWMSLKIFKFNGKSFDDVTTSYGLKKYSGLWQKIKITDIDGDGDIDIIAGNFGLNTRYKASKKEPLTCYGGDLDNNDFLDPILCMFSEGKNYPVQRKNTLSATLPMVKKKYVKNADYASASVTELFGIEALRNVPKYEVNTLESCVFINDNGSFKKIDLPIEAQAFPVRAIEYNKSTKRLFIAGSIDGMEVINGPNNGGYGLVLERQGEGWRSLSMLDSGLYIPYSTNEFKIIHNRKKQSILLVANHNGPLMAFKQN